MNGIDRTPWQPCIAADWHSLQVKRAFSVTLGKMLQNSPSASSEIEVPYLKAQHVQWDRVQLSDLPTMWASEAEIDALLVRSGDLLVCEGGEVGRAAIVAGAPQGRTIIQNALHLVRGRNGAEPRFLAYLLKHASNQGWFDIICNRSTIAHFTVEKFEEQWVYLPDEDQQRAIADYLDRETARLDALVAAKERLLDLLTEKRRALITRAVTRGLGAVEQAHPDPVGLGDHAAVAGGDGVRVSTQRRWPTKRLRHVMQRGLSSDNRQRLARASRVTFLPMEAIGEQGRLDTSRVRDLEDVRSGYTQCFDGDVLVAKITPCFENGKGALVSNTLDGVAYGTTELYVLRPSAEIHGKFLYYVTTDPRFRVAGTACMTGAAGQQRVPEDFIRNYRMPVPQWRKQRAIADYLDRETARLDTLSSMTEDTIALLKERRASLISAAVTGQIDVKEEACELRS